MEKRVRFCLEKNREYQQAPYYRLLFFKEKFNEKLVKFTNDTKSLHLSSDESKKSSQESCSFSALPVTYSKAGIHSWFLYLRSFQIQSSDVINQSQNRPTRQDEVILKIFENLDWKSLCRVSSVNKRLNRIAQDPCLYTSLNISRICHPNLYEYQSPNYISDQSSLFCYFKSRCKYLRRLNLSRFHIESSDFLKFLIPRGRHLTHLRLHNCNCINDSTLPQIVKICQNLKVLNLGEYNLTDEGISCLENLQFLECLNIIRVYIKSETLYKILRRNQRIRHLYVTIINPINIINPEYMNADDVAVKLKNLCPDLENISVKTYSAPTVQFIHALGDNKNLQKGDFTMCFCFHGFCFM